MYAREVGDVNRACANNNNGRLCDSGEKPERDLAFLEAVLTASRVYGETTASETRRLSELSNKQQFARASPIPREGNNNTSVAKWNANRSGDFCEKP